MIAGFAIVGAASSPPAVPETMVYTGQLRVDSALYTGESLWRFAIVNSTGGILWTNDGSASLPPAAGVARRVAAGRVSIALGAKASPAESMQPLPAGVFSAPQTYLRAWVAAPTTAQPEELVASETPIPHAQAFTSVPYSHRAARASQADEADHAARADVAHSLTPAAAGQPVEVQGDLVVKGRITSAGNSPSPQGGEGGGEGEGKRGRVTFDTVTTRHLIVTDSVSLPGGGVFTSTVTQIQTLVVQSSVTLTGPAVLKAGAKLSRGTDALFLDTPANAITYTQGVGAATPQIRTADVGSEAVPAATGATPLLINAGLAGSLSLNPFSSGNVGIGTDSPATRLHVAGGLAVTGGGSVGINTTTPHRELQIMAAGPLIEDEIGIRLQHQPGSQAWDLMAFPDGNFAIGRDGDSLFRALTISPVNAAHPTGGRVAVGLGITPTPAARLHVKGSADDAAIFRADQSTPVGAPESPAFVVTTDGKVGIGTAGPAARLDIQQMDASINTTALRVQTGAPTPTTKFSVDGAGNAMGGGNLMVNGLLSATNGVSFDGGTLHVDSVNKRVGIGTTAPAARLDVQQTDSTDATTALRIRTGAGLEVSDKLLVNGAGDTTLLSNGDVGPNLLLRNLTNGALWTFGVDGVMSGDLDLTDNGVSRLYFQRSTGHVGIGTGQVPGAELHVAHGGTTRLRLTDETLGSGGSWELATVNAPGGARSAIREITPVGFQLVATERLSVLPGGNVGIGAASPAARLHVEQGAGGTDDLIVARTGTGAANDKFKVSSVGDATVAGALVVDGNTLTVDKTTHRVGVSVASPAEALDVAGNAQVSGQVKFTGAGTVAAGGTNQNLTMQGSGTGNVLLAPTGGNVGINTPTPVEKFEVHGGNIVAVRSDAATDVRVANTAVSGKTYALRSTTDGKFQVVDSPGAAGEAVRATVASDGKVGIGTDAPAERLHVVGRVRISGDNQLILHNPSSGREFGLISNGGGTFDIFDRTASATRLVMDSDGNIGIGNTPALNTRLHVAGKMLVSGGQFDVASSAMPGTVRMRMGELSDGPGDFQIRTNAALTAAGAQDDITRPSWVVRMGPALDDFAVIRRPRLDQNPGAPFVQRIRVDADGNLDVIGHIFAHSGAVHVDNRADVAERFEVSGPFTAGDAMMADIARPGALKVCNEPRSPAFAGIISATPGVVLNERVQGPPVGIVGRMLAKVSAENGPIRPGTPLTTAGTAGHLMAADSQTPAAAIVGISLGNLEAGTGMIEVLLK